jgi:NAD(P)-dependent dehydrogenase (short-subunit alcohol dehydrogenase family)
MLLRLLASVRSLRSAQALALVTVSLAAPEVAAQPAERMPAVLVTGTSSGIGLRMTEVLSENGFFVYAGARQPNDLARLDAMENVKAVRLDVTVQRDIDAAVALIRAEGRGLYGLINNAGIAVMGPLIELSERDMEAQLDVNLLGPYRMTRAFADLLIESTGRVLTVGSIAGILSGPFNGAYSMSKHGVEAYTDALAAELARFNVAVAVVEPGNFKSQILVSMVKRMEASGYSAEGSRYGSMLDMISGPLDRSQYEAPDAVAQAALDFLSSASPKRRYMIVPNQYEADITLRQAFREVAQLNEGHPFSHSRDELVAMLDEALGVPRPSPAPPTDTAPGVGLHQAIVEGDLGAVRAHINAGSDLNVQEPSGGSSPLITAAMFGRAEATRALIAAGADVDQRNNDGSTALLTAALLCRTEIVEALLAAGADESIRNNTGATALGVVSVPFDSIRGIYDYLGAVLGPYGLKLDYERIERTRPVIADMLRR